MSQAVDYRTSSHSIYIGECRRKVFVRGSLSSKTMAAAEAAAKQGMWIARMWRMGWQKIPVVMASHCLTAPFFLYFVGQRLFFGRPEVPVEKYRNKYTVVRPGDPRIARINNYSSIDKVGIFS